MEQDYIAKARQAEDFAAQSIDAVEKRYWKRVAEDYRRLAVFVEPGCRSFAWKPDAHAPRHKR